MSARAAYAFWGDDEIAQVRALAPTHTAEEIGAVLGRTEEQVRGISKRKGISMGRKNASTAARVRWSKVTGSMRPEAKPFVERFLNAGWAPAVVGWLFDIDPKEVANEQG